MHPIQLLSLAAFAALSACSSGSPGKTPVGSVSAAPGGSTLTVSEGPLAGFELDVPAGSLARDVELGVALAPPTAYPGYATLSDSADVFPTGVDLRIPARLTLPFREGAITGTSAVVLVERDDGSLLELAALIPEPGIAQTVTPFFGRFTVVERRFGGHDLDDYLPLGDGDVWNFSNGLKAEMTRPGDEPNFGGTPVFRLAIDTPNDDLGLYFENTPTGIRLLGDFSTVGGRNQQVFYDDGLAFLPTPVVMGRTMVAPYTFTRFSPYGTTVPLEAGRGVAFLRLTPEGSITVAGQFYTDLVRLDLSLHSVVDTPTGPGAAEVFETSITFARDVGPVRVEAYGVEGFMFEATVNGQLIAPQ